MNEVNANLGAVPPSIHERWQQFLLCHPKMMNRMIYDMLVNFWSNYVFDDLSAKFSEFMAKSLGSWRCELFPPCRSREAFSNEC